MPVINRYTHPGWTTEQALAWFRRTYPHAPPIASDRAVSEFRMFGPISEWNHRTAPEGQGVLKVWKKSASFLGGRYASGWSWECVHRSHWSNKVHRLVSVHGQGKTWEQAADRASTHYRKHHGRS